MREDRSIEVASLLAKAWRGDLAPLPDDVCRAIPLEAAFPMQIAACHAADVHPLAWKLGASTTTSRRALGLNAVFAGPVEAANLFLVPSKIHGFCGPKTIIECEIAIRMRVRDWIMNPSADAKKFVISVHPALELPASRFREIGTGGPEALIADFGAAGAAVIGAETCCMHLLEAEHPIGCQLWINGQLKATGSSEALVSSPLELLSDARNLISAYPNPPTDAFLLLGALASVTGVSIGDRVACNFDGLGSIETLFA